MKILLLSSFLFLLPCSVFSETFSFDLKAMATACFQAGWYRGYITAILHKNESITADSLWKRDSITYTDNLNKIK